MMPAKSFLVDDLLLLPPGDPDIVWQFQTCQPGPDSDSARKSITLPELGLTLPFLKTESLEHLLDFQQSG